VLPTSAMIEEMFTIEPPPRFIISAAARRVPRNTLVWLTAMILSQPLRPSWSLSIEPLTPALFTRMSSLP
jgi:hypothetical protein